MPGDVPNVPPTVPPADGYTMQPMTALNWKPRYTDLRAIVETAWNWHRSHPKGYDDKGR